MRYNECLHSREVCHRVTRGSHSIEVSVVLLMPILQFLPLRAWVRGLFCWPCFVVYVKRPFEAFG
jgi:hypothetical protein